jgi:tetratricopeptide (TPR) repeat protein
MDPQHRTQLRALIDAEKWAEARALLDSIKPPTEEFEWLAVRAEVEAGMGQLEQAATLYERALQLRPESPSALYNSSLVLSDLGRHEDAMAALEAVIEIEGESAAVCNDLSYEYLEAGHHVPAWLAAARAEQLANDEPQRCLARLNGATALANMGRRADARARLDVMLQECTNACGERESALELRQSLDRRHRRRSLAG